MINYEDRILAILLQHPEVFKRASQFLKREAIRGEALKYVYGQMQALLDASKKRTPPPLDVLKARILEDKPADGQNYTGLIDRLIEQPLNPGEENLLEHYVDEVHRDFKELQFKETLVSIAEAVSKRDMGRAESILSRAASKYSPRSASIFRGDVFADVNEELLFSSLIKSDASLYAPIPTGLREIDDAVGGLFKTEVGLVQAMPGGGKSTFLMNVAINAIHNNFKVVLVTLEMSKRQYWWRIASRMTEIPYRDFKFGTLTKEQESECRDLFAALHGNGSRLEILHFPRGATAKDIESAILELPYEADLVVVDYLNRMHAEAKFGADQNWLSTGAAMEELVGMAGSIYLGKGVACWTGQQLKSGKEGQRNQTTSDAAFSAVPGHHAHAVTYITNTKDGFFMGAAKWRDGKVPEFQIYPDFARFKITQERPQYVHTVSPGKAPALPTGKQVTASPDGSLARQPVDDKDF